MIAAVAVLLLSVPAWAQDIDHSHAGLTRVLSEYVDAARVDYAGLQAEPDALDHYLSDMERVTSEQFDAWEEAQQLAYLINRYNAETLRLIIDHYPIKSIKNIGNVLKGPWDQPIVRLFGETITLNTIEHEILRKEYQEPRVHFALVCAAVGCPPLRAEAYSATRLDTQLEDQGRIFMANQKKNYYDADKQVLQLSPIFKWFRTDFETEKRSLQAFVAPYFSQATAALLADRKAKLKFTYYDWSLNSQS